MNTETAIALITLGLVIGVVGNTLAVNYRLAAPVDASFRTLPVVFVSLVVFAGLDMFRPLAIGTILLFLTVALLYSSVGGIGRSTEDETDLSALFVFSLVFLSGPFAVLLGGWIALETLLGESGLPVSLITEYSFSSTLTVVFCVVVSLVATAFCRSKIKNRTSIIDSSVFGWFPLIVLAGYYLAVITSGVTVGPVVPTVDAGIGLTTGLLAGTLASDSVFTPSSSSSSSPSQNQSKGTYGVQNKLSEMPSRDRMAPETGAVALKEDAEASLEAGEYDTAYETAREAVRQRRTENALAELERALEELTGHSAEAERIRKKIRDTTNDLRANGVDDIQVRKSINDIASTVAEEATELYPGGSDTSEELLAHVETAKDAQYLSERAEAAKTAAEVAAEAAHEYRDEIQSDATEAIEHAESWIETEESDSPRDDVSLEAARHWLERAKQAHTEDEYSQAEQLADRATLVATAEAELHRAEWIYGILTESLPDGTQVDGVLPTDITEQRLSDAYVDLKNGNVRTAVDSASEILGEIQQRRDDHVDTQLSLIAPLETRTDIESVNDPARKAREAAANDDWQRALRAADEARTAAISELPDRLAALHRDITSALDSDDYQTAKTSFDRFEQIAETLIDIAEAEDRPRVVESTRVMRRELDEALEDQKAAVREDVKQLQEQAERLRSRADEHREKGDVVEAVRTYADAIDTLENAGERLASFDTETAVEYAERADRIEPELESAAETAIERAFECIPDDEFDVLDEAFEVRQEAASALDRGEFIEAVERANEAVETARERLREFITRKRTAAKKALENSDYSTARAETQRGIEACESVREIAIADSDSGFVDGIDTTRSELESFLDEVSSQAKSDVETRCESAKSDLERADALFEDGDYDEAKIAYGAVRDNYIEAEKIATAFDLDSAEVCARGREQAAERLGYCQLASLSDRLESLQPRIHEAPSDAVEAFDDLLTEIEDLSFERAAQSASREELLIEATRGHLQARTERGRKLMADAESLYDDGDRYAARDRYQEAQDHLDTVAGALEDSPLDDLPLLEELQSVCEGNIEFISQELAGVASIRSADDGIERVGVPGESISDTDERPPDDSERSPTTADTVPSDEARSESSMATGSAVSGTAAVAERHDLLGEGGNAKVWHVTLEDGRDAALKVPKWSGTLARTDIERFEREAETWSKLDDHPNVVSVYDWGVDAEPWLLMEYVPDGSLDERIGDISTRQALKIVAEIADALVHARGVAHLDIKPENVLMDGETPKLADWGLAKVAFADEGTETQLGMSPPYAAPEQVDRTRGGRDHRTDIYQLGVTAYELLTGRLPYPPGEPESLETRILTGEPTPPSEILDVSSAVDEVVLRAMAVDRADRYEAPIQFRDALNGLPDEI